MNTAVNRGEHWHYFASCVSALDSQTSCYADDIFLLAGEVLGDLFEEFSRLLKNFDENLDCTYARRMLAGVLSLMCVSVLLEVHTLTWLWVWAVPQSLMLACYCTF